MAATWCWDEASFLAATWLVLPKYHWESDTWNPEKRIFCQEFAGGCPCMPQKAESFTSPAVRSYRRQSLRAYLAPLCLWVHSSCWISLGGSYPPLGIPYSREFGLGLAGRPCQTARLEPLNTSVVSLNLKFRWNWSFWDPAG